MLLLRLMSPAQLFEALNNRGVVDPKTRAKVKGIAQQLSYHPSLRAHRLKTGKISCIALIFSMPEAKKLLNELNIKGALVVEPTE